MRQTNMHRESTRTIGFTLIELLVALTIASALTVIALPTLKDSMRQNTLSRSASLVKGAFINARSQAIRTGRPFGVVVERLRRRIGEGTADTLISPGNLFRLPDDTIHPAALFELMAQAYAAVHGYQNHLAGKPVSIGYLAGITRAIVHGAARVGDRLTVSVRRTALVQPFIRAAALIVRDGETLAEGELTLFVPPIGEEPS